MVWIGEISRCVINRSAPTHLQGTEGDLGMEDWVFKRWMGFWGFQTMGKYEVFTFGLVAGLVGEWAVEGSQLQRR